MFSCWPRKTNYSQRSFGSSILHNNGKFNIHSKISTFYSFHSNLSFLLKYFLFYEWSFLLFSLSFYSWRMGNLLSFPSFRIRISVYKLKFILFIFFSFNFIPFSVWLWKTIEHLTHTQNAHAHTHKHTLNIHNPQSNQKSEFYEIDAKTNTQSINQSIDRKWCLKYIKMKLFEQDIGPLKRSLSAKSRRFSRISEIALVTNCFWPQTCIKQRVNVSYNYCHCVCDVLYFTYLISLDLSSPNNPHFFFLFDFLLPN